MVFGQVDIAIGDHFHHKLLESDSLTSGQVPLNVLPDQVGEVPACHHPNADEGGEERRALQLRPLGEGVEGNQTEEVEQCLSGRKTVNKVSFSPLERDSTLTGGGNRRFLAP